MFGAADNAHVPRQLYQIGGAPGATCRTLAPAADLAASVHYHWTLDIVADRVALPVIPDNAVDLVLCPGTGGFAALYFPVDEAFTIPLEGPIRYIGTCLRLERLGSVLGREPDALRRLAPGSDTVLALALEPLLERLRDGAEPAAVARHLDDFLRTSSREASGSDDDGREDAASPLERFLDTLESGRVAETARHLGVSERQLRRETHRLFGLAPKKIQRVVRLQRAIAELIDGAPPTADYHDDSHRIRELRALTGWTPGEIRRLAETYNTDRRRP